MKFQPDSLDGVNTIARLDGASIWVGGRRHTGSVIVPWVGPVQTWSAERFDALQPSHFDELIARKPELVILGTGAQLRFPAPALLRGLMAQRIGVETMDVSAACRTFNVLVSEGRSVVGALLLGSTDS